MENAQYTYLPWLRKGLASKITQEEKLGKGNYSRAKIDFKIKIIDHTYDNKIQFSLLDSGDIKVNKITDADVFIEPKRFERNYEPNYIPYIQFFEEDLPWRFSPAKANKKGQLRPWLQLIALKPDEFSFNGISKANYSTIRINKGTPIPKHDEYYLWAHVQIDEIIGTDKTIINNIINKKPERISSRILCPRKLAPNTSYHLFLIPAFERGRLAGLSNEAITEDNSQQYALIDIKNKDIETPFYYNWEFSTSKEAVDFEELARKIKKIDAGSLAGLGQKKIDLSDAGNGLSSGQDISLYGALTVSTNGEKENSNNLEGSKFNKVLKKLLNGTDSIDDDPIINPPIYGGKHRRVNQVGKIKWIDQLNLDPAYRTIAGLGAEVFKEHQDRFMDIAWKQYGEIKEANNLLRIANAVELVSNNYHKKYIQNASLEKTLQISKEVHHLIKINKKFTLEGAFRKGIIPSIILTKSFSKIKNVSSKMDFIEDINQLEFINETPIFTKTNKQVYTTENYLKKAQGSFISNLQPITYSYNSKTINISTLQKTIKEALSPDINISKKLKYLINGGNNGVKDQRKDQRIDQIMASPTIEEPLSKYLTGKHLDLFIPSINEFSNNAISLMVTNPKYIESFLVGFNYEMARELLWRKYPTDQRGTYARNFWDSKIKKSDKNTTSDENTTCDENTTSDENTTNDIHNWGNELGKNLSNKNANLALILRGDLLYKYPNTIIYLQKTKTKSSGDKIILDNDTIIFPTFSAKITKDIQTLGFDIEVIDAKEDYFVILQEAPGDTRFGLDVTSDKEKDKIDNESDLAWNHLTTEVNEYIKSNDFIDKINWGINGHHQAKILNQKPFKLAIKASNLL